MRPNRLPRRALPPRAGQWRNWRAAHPGGAGPEARRSAMRTARAPGAPDRSTGRPPRPGGGGPRRLDLAGPQPAANAGPTGEPVENAQARGVAPSRGSTLALRVPDYSRAASGRGWTRACPRTPRLLQWTRPAAAVAAPA